MKAEQPKHAARESGTEDSPNRIFESEGEIAEYLAEKPGGPRIRIHVVGTPDAPRIMVSPNPASARQWLDEVEWDEGANCGEWEVAFKETSPLDPAGPFRDSGPRGGVAVGDPGIYRYGVRARDLRTGDWVEEDPDVVIMPGKRF